MNERKQQMIQDRKNGMKLEDIARKHGVSRTRVTQILGRQCAKNYQPVQKCPWPELKRWMNENKISRMELTRRLYGNGHSGNVAKVQAMIRGEKEPRKWMIDKLLEITGLKYEVLFREEESHD